MTTHEEALRLAHTINETILDIAAPDDVRVPDLVEMVVRLAALSAPAAEPTTYRPSPETVQAALALVDRIKASYNYWQGWSGTPSSCETISNLLRYGVTEPGAEPDVVTDATLSAPADMVLLPRNPRRLTTEQTEVLLRLENGKISIFAAWDGIVSSALSAPAQQPLPDCGACPGDGTVCVTGCRLADESPPIYPPLPQPSVILYNDIGYTKAGTYWSADQMHAYAIAALAASQAAPAQQPLTAEHVKCIALEVGIAAGIADQRTESGRMLLAFAQCIEREHGITAPAQQERESQQHVPQLLVEFEPVPANSPSDAKGWKDRDTIAAVLTAAPAQPQALASSDPEGHRQAIVDAQAEQPVPAYEQVATPEGDRGPAAAAPAAPKQQADFDSWQENPYTKALQKSIAEDYMPRHPQAEPVAYFDWIVGKEYDKRMHWIDTVGDPAGKKWVPDFRWQYLYTHPPTDVALSVLRELVACKRLREVNLADVGAIQLRAIVDEYERRMPAAWAAAFALVDGKPQGLTDA